MTKKQSRTTHGAPATIDCCETLAEILASAIRGITLSELVASEAARRVKGFRPSQPRSEVRGIGYVVSCLHAALCAVSRTSTFTDAVLLAANLGENADTTAAVTEQIARALYGARGIPAEWLVQLTWVDRIRNVAESLFDAS